MCDEAVLPSELRAYIETLHRELDALIAEHGLDRGDMTTRHASLLPAAIRGYISPGQGLAIEYTTSDQTSVEVETGSGLIEELVLRLGIDESTKFAALVKAQDCGFINCRFTNGIPFKLGSRLASAFLENVKITLHKQEREIQFAEFNANTDKSNWTTRKAVERAREEALQAALIALKASKSGLTLSEYIERFKAKAVLVLGSYSPRGKQRLKTISEHLESLGFEGLIIDEIPDVESQSLAQKVVTAGSLCRFVIVDDSEKSGHIRELELCKQNSWVTAIMHPDAGPSTWMTAGLTVGTDLLRSIAYSGEAPDRRVVQDAVEWASNRVASLKAEFSKVWPWRPRQRGADSD